jgi:hypothetical protein
MVVKDDVPRRKLQARWAEHGRMAWRLVAGLNGYVAIRSRRHCVLLDAGGPADGHVD